MKQDVTRTQVRIPNDICEKAKRLAVSKGISLNELIVEALKDISLKDRASQPSKVKEALDLITYTMERMNHEQ